MQSFNHVAGGYAFAGLFCSFADVNIFDRFDTMAIVWVAAVLPDIDHTKSISGKIVYPLAKWIQTKYGHRTITHSIFFYVAVVAVCKGFDNLFHQHFTLPVALALASHLIFDMCTKQGIPLFYPFSRRPAVLPANPKLRLSANDFRSEAIVFVVFCCLNVFSYPLMAAGFWTKYNKAFLTWDHLEREAKHKPGDYEARFLVPDSDTIAAIIVEQKAAQLRVWRDNHFELFDPVKCKLIDFRKVASKHEFKTVNLLQVSTDSLNTYMKLPVVKITAQSEQELFYFEGPIMKKGNDLTADYPNNAKFQQLAIDNAHTEAELKLLNADYRASQRKYAFESGKIRADITELRQLSTTTGLSDYEEGKRRDRMKELKLRVQTAVPPEPVDHEVYRIRKAMLEHQLRETAHVNATLLIWSAQDGRQN